MGKNLVVFSDIKANNEPLKWEVVKNTAIYRVQSDDNQFCQLSSKEVVEAWNNRLPKGIRMKNGTLIIQDFQRFCKKHPASFLRVRDEDEERVGTNHPLSNLISGSQLSRLMIKEKKTLDLTKLEYDIHDYLSFESITSARNNGARWRRTGVYLKQLKDEANDYENRILSNPVIGSYLFDILVQLKNSEPQRALKEKKAMLMEVLLNEMVCQVKVPFSLMELKRLSFFYKKATDVIMEGFQNPEDKIIYETINLSLSDERYQTPVKAVFLKLKAELKKLGLLESYQAIVTQIDQLLYEKTEKKPESISPINKHYRAITSIITSDSEKEIKPQKNQFVGGVIDFLNQHLNPGLRDTIRQSVQEKMLYIKRDSLLEQRLCDIADKVKGKRLVLDVLVRCVGAEIMSYLHNFNQSNEMKDEADKESSFNIQ